MKVLVIAQVLDRADDNQGPFYYWCEELARRVDQLIIICLRSGVYDLPSNARVYSLGKDRGVPKWRQVIRFYQILWKERGNFDLIFAHQCPDYLTGATLFTPRTPKVLWFALGDVSLRLRLAELLSRRVLTSTREGFRLRSKKVAVIGQGINPALFRFQSNVTLHRPLRLLFVGRISPQKGLETLIEAGKRLQKAGVSFALTIAGRALTPEARVYEQHIHETGEKALGRLISFPGKIPYSELPAFLTHYDLFINPSKTGSLDRALLDAMAAGLVPITSNEAFAEILSPDDRKRLIFPHGGVEALADRIKAVVRLRPPERDGLRLKLRRMVEKDHSVTHLVDGMMREFQGVV